MGVNFNRPEPYWSQAADGSYFIKKGAPRLTRVDSLTLTKESNVTGTATEVINPRWEPYWSQAADGSYFIKKGAPRLTRVDSLTLTKESNVTGTATEVINPRWDNVDNPHMVNVNLGNNGKLSIEMPGSLAINKDARIAPNKDIDPKVLDGKSFEFEITIPSAAGTTLTTEVRNAQNERVGEPVDKELCRAPWRSTKTPASRRTRTSIPRFWMERASSSRSPFHLLPARP